MGEYSWATAGNGLTTARDFARHRLPDAARGRLERQPGFSRDLAPAVHGLGGVSEHPLECGLPLGEQVPADIYRTTGSGQNWVLVVPSFDLVATFNGRTPNTLANEIDSTSLSRLFDAVTEPYVACDGTLVNGGTPPVGNVSPEASFGTSCAGLSCGFHDTSTDPDGTVTAWSWSFGDGSSSSAHSPSHTYVTPGTYTVLLTATDDRGATATATRSVTVTGITLTATGRKKKGLAYGDLSWRGAAGQAVEVHRDAARLATAPNTGAYTDATGRKGAANTPIGSVRSGPASVPTSSP